VLGPALSRRLGYPPFFLSHSRHTNGASIRGAAPLAGTFPVVLYSHEWGEFRTIALNQVESLASHGYVVIAADHSYAALATRFPDDEVIDLDPASLPTAGEVDAETRANLSEQLITTMTDDLIGIIDSLALEEAGPFGQLAPHADLGRIGAFGHGAGAGAVVGLCLVDTRCRGAVGLDPWVEPIQDRVIAVTAAVPMLFMRSDEWRGTNNDGRLRGMAERSGERTYWLGISGAAHNDFVMAPLFSPVADRLGMKGPIRAARIVPIVDRYLVGFFDHVLLEAGTAAIDRSPFAEVSLEVLG
jgi:dienelactone hydrolase